MTLRLASYNIRKCLGTDRRRDPARVVEVIAAIGADVVTLQEVDLRLGARPAALTRAQVEAGTDHVPVDLAGSPHSLGWHGQTILVRRGLRVTGCDRLDLPGLEPRGAVLAEIETPQGALRVVGVHLGLLRRYRLRQVAAIRAALAPRQRMPTAILGDFNEWSRRRGLNGFGARFEVHAPGASFHARRPVAALDRVVLGDGLELHRAGVLDTPLARRASDHLPVWADVTCP